MIHSPRFPFSTPSAPSADQPATSQGHALLLFGLTLTLPARFGLRRPLRLVLGTGLLAALAFEVLTAGDV